MPPPPQHPALFAREGRNFLRDPSGKAHLLRNASSWRVGARICVCIFGGGRHCWGPPPPRSKARLLMGCAARPRSGAGPLPPSLPLFLPPPPPPAGQRRRVQRGWAAGASCGRASRLQGEAGGKRSPPGLGLPGSPLLKFGRPAGTLREVGSTHSPHRGARRGRPRGCDAACCRRQPEEPRVRSEACRYPRNPRLGKRGLGAPLTAGGCWEKPGGCVHTWGAGNGVCRRDGDGDNGICFGDGDKDSLSAPRWPCRLGEALCRLLRFGRAAA